MPHAYDTGTRQIGVQGRRLLLNPRRRRRHRGSRRLGGGCERLLRRGLRSNRRHRLCYQRHPWEGKRLILDRQLGTMPRTHTKATVLRWGVAE